MKISSKSGNFLREIFTFAARAVTEFLKVFAASV